MPVFFCQANTGSWSENFKSGKDCLLRPVTWFHALNCGMTDICFAQAFVLMGVGDAMALYICSGPLATVLVVLVFGDRITCLESLSLALCCVGVLLIVRPPGLINLLQLDGLGIDFSRGDFVETNWAYAWCGTATLFSALAMLSIADCVRANGKTATWFIRMLGPVVIGTIFTIAFSGSVVPTTERFLFLLVSCFVFLGSTIGWTIASGLIPISHQSIIFSFDKIWAYAFGLLLFGEQLYMLSITGAASIWVGLITIATQVDLPDEEEEDEFEDFDSEKEHKHIYGATEDSESSIIKCV